MDTNCFETYAGASCCFCHAWQVSDERTRRLVEKGKSGGACRSANELHRCLCGSIRGDCNLCQRERREIGLFSFFPLFPKCFELETDERAEQVCKTDVTTEMEIFVTPREQMSFHDHNKIYIAGIIILYVSSHGNIRAVVQSKMFRIFFLVRENKIVFTRKIKIR